MGMQLCRTEQYCENSAAHGIAKPCKLEVTLALPNVSICGFMRLPAQRNGSCHWRFRKSSESRKSESSNQHLQALLARLISKHEVLWKPWADHLVNSEYQCPSSAVIVRRQAFFKHTSHNFSAVYGVNAVIHGSVNNM